MKQIVSKSFILALCSVLLSTAAFGRAVDCSAFEHGKDGSWTVTKATRLAGLKNGVSRSVGLAPGERFSRGGKSSMGGVAVFHAVETNCR